MQFFTRIIAQMLHGPLGEKLANAKWMQNLAQNTHKAMERGGKMAAEHKVTWDATRNAMKENVSQMKSEANSSPLANYFKGLKEEVNQLKAQMKDGESPQIKK